MQTSQRLVRRRPPKDLRENLKYRTALRRAAIGNKALQEALKEASRLDPLFFFNTFLWLYEPRPRKGLPKKVPFITWPHQDPVIEELERAIEFSDGEDFGVEAGRDCGLEKSRGEGASWICMMVILRRWLFDDLFAAGCVSKTELDCDNPTNPDSLFWKLDWQIEQLPGWMVPEYTRTTSKHSFYNHEKKSTIQGFAAIGDVASGGRKTLFFMDELAKFPRPADRESMDSVQFVTNCRIFVSTPKGAEGKYYELMHEPSNMLKLRLHWTDNPTRNRGMYRVVRGQFVAVDPQNNPLPPGYEAKAKPLLEDLRLKGFKIEDVVRSPWYDHQCNRPGATPAGIAQELDLDYGGSEYPVFSDDFKHVAKMSTGAPTLEGRFGYDTETLEFDWQTQAGGPFKLWVPLDLDRKPPSHTQYVAGVDISSGRAGTHTSNSVISVWDRITGHQAAEFAINSMPPEVFAPFCIAVCRWFRDAFLIFEGNYAGQTFVNATTQWRYTNVYWRLTEFKQTRRRQNRMGWWASDSAKQSVLDEFSRAVSAKEAVLRSDWTLQECSEFVIEKGKYQHRAERSNDDADGAKAHGDRVIAAALAWEGIRYLGAPRGNIAAKAVDPADPDYTTEPPKGSMAYRFAEMERELERLQDNSEDFE